MLKLINPAGGGYTVAGQKFVKSIQELGVMQEFRGDEIVERTDAAGDTMHLARELEFVSAQSTQVLTDPIKGRLFVPFTPIPDGAETFSYDEWDRTALVEWITNYASVVGSADVSKNRSFIPMSDFGSSYHYSVMDLQRSAFARTSVNAERATSCRIGHEQFLDRVIAEGREEVGVSGLLNSEAFQAVVPDTGQWDPTDPEPSDPDDYELKSTALYNDLLKLIDSVSIRSAENFECDFVVLPLSFKSMLSRRFSRYDARSRLQCVTDARPGVSINFWKKLDTASTLGGPKALAYKKSSQVLEFVIAYDFRELPPQAAGYSLQVPTYSRVGGLVVRYPLACSRMDLDEDPTP